MATRACQEIRALAETGKFDLPSRAGMTTEVDIREAWRDHVLSYVEADRLRPVSIVCNAGNGGAGMYLDLLEDRLPFRFTKIHHEADGSFPNGVPNPMIEENREVTARHVRLARADIGIAFDGDFDRCFFFDEEGRFVDGYYIVGLLAGTFLEKHKGAPIVHDPRVVWNTQHVVRALGGRPVQCKSGHAFMKACMRKADAIYGGEMSGHHYFRDFAYCDSGMIPWVILAQHLSRTGMKLSTLVEERMKMFPSSGEINRKHRRRRGGDGGRAPALPARGSQDRGRGRALHRAHALALQPPQLQHRAAACASTSSRAASRRS